MRSIVRSSIFKKDYKRILKRHYPEQKFREILHFLINDIELPTHYKAHKLSGEYSNFWECHIAPDWLLIYQLNDQELILRRTGSHADLFK